MAPPSWMSSLNQVKPSDDAPAAADARGDPIALFEAWTNVDYNDANTSQTQSPLGHALNFDSDLSFVAYKSNNRRAYELGFGNASKPNRTPLVGVSSVDPSLLLTSEEASGSDFGLASDGSTLLNPRVASSFHNGVATSSLTPSSSSALPIDPSLTTEAVEVLPLPVEDDATQQVTSQRALKKPRGGSSNKKVGKGNALQNSVKSADGDISLNASTTEEQVAYEEDKRKRNTEASARFRVKKKQREQALAEEAKALRAKVEDLEAHVKNLSMENTWLRGLILAKGQGKSISASDQKMLDQGSPVTAASTPTSSDANSIPAKAVPAKRSASKIA